MTRRNSYPGVAENLFLRKQLALFQERKTTRHRKTASFRLAMVALAKFLNWRNALMIVKPETFVGWHLTAFKMFWRWKSRKPGRPALPKGSTCPGTSTGALKVNTVFWSHASARTAGIIAPSSPMQMDKERMRVNPPFSRLPSCSATELSLACPFRLLHTFLLLRPARHYPRVWI